MTSAAIGSSDDGALQADDPGRPVELADQLAALARSVPGVVDLHGGVFGEVATYLPGRRLAGIRIAPDRVEVHVSVLWDEPVRATAEAVSTRLEPVAGRPVDVTVDDVVRPGFPAGGTDPSGPTGPGLSFPASSSSSPKEFPS